MSGAALSAWAYPEWLPKVSSADSFVANRDVIVSVFLRGGADGLSLCAPFGDPLYYTGRPTIAIPRPDSTATTKGIALDNFFAFPQAMRFLVPAYQAGDLLVVHGSGLTYNPRSHFDAQPYLEIGQGNAAPYGCAGSAAASTRGEVGPSAPSSVPSRIDRSRSTAPGTAN